MSKELFVLLPNNKENLDCVEICFHLNNPYKYGDSIDQYRTIAIQHKNLGNEQRQIFYIEELTYSDIVAKLNKVWDVITEGK